jgi:DNA helicase-2/ATP-dependent DNA helicase PcrA
MEDGIFPSINSAMDPTELAEERRLAYVAITRAKEELIISKANERVLYGRTSHNPQSRFIDEIDAAYLRKEDNTRANVFSRSIPTSPKTSTSRMGGGMSARPSSAQATGNVSFIRFNAGDKVSHFQFGSGTVLSVTPMGSDLLYEISFDKVGNKKMMATFAKLKRGE